MLAAACGVRLNGGGDEPQPDSSQTTPDASQGGPDAPDTPMLGPWGPPKLVPGASSTTLAEDDASLSSTAKEMVFAVVNAAITPATKDLYYMSRQSTTSPWSTPVKLLFNDDVASDETPRFSDDDLTLYFASGRAGGLDIWKVQRTTVDSPWGPPAHVDGVNTAGTDKWFVPCPGTNIYLTILGTDIGQGTMGNPPAVCDELSSTSSETGTFVSRDCKTVYFASNRSGTNRLYVASRPAVGMPFNPPEMVVDFLGLGGNQEDPWLSPDLRTFVFVSDIGTGLTKDVYISTR